MDKDNNGKCVKFNTQFCCPIKNPTTTVTTTTISPTTTTLKITTTTTTTTITTTNTPQTTTTATTTTPSSELVKHVSVTTSIRVTINTIFDSRLQDTSSTLYTQKSQAILAVFNVQLRLTAAKFSMSVSTTTVKFSLFSLRAGNEQQLREWTTIAVIEAVMEKEVPVDEMVDKDALTNAVTDEITESAIKSIEEGDGGSIDNDVVPHLVVIEVEVTDVSTTPEREEPLFRLLQLHRKIEDVIDNNFAKWSGWSNRIKRVIQDRINRMQKDFNTKLDTCEFSIAEVSTDENK